MKKKLTYNEIKKAWSRGGTTTKKRYGNKHFSKLAIDRWKKENETISPKEKVQ